MPRWFGLAALVLLTLLSAEVQLLGVSSQAGLRVGATTRELRQTLVKQGTHAVTTCGELQNALKDTYVYQIFVDGAIVCTRTNWPKPIVVRRNVLVSGQISKLDSVGRPNSTDVLQHSVDWTNLSKVVVVERGATLSFYDMLMRQAEMGLAGFNIAFLHTRQSSTGVFAGIVMIVDTCPEPVGFFQVAFSGLERPQFAAGEQRTRALGPSAFLIEDISILWPQILSLWQICNMVFECGVTDPSDPAILEHFQKPYTLPVCTAPDDDARGDDMPLSGVTSGSEDSGTNTMGDAALTRSGHTSVVGTVVLVVAVTGLVVAMTAVLTYYLIFKARKQSSPAPPKASSHKDEPSTSKRKARKSDARLQENSFAYELFEKNINVPLQDVEVGSMLGRGGFGKVYKGTWKGTTVAIKVIEHGERLMENELKLPFEAYLSKHISHPNVVQTFIIHTRQQDSPHGVTVDTMDLNDSSTQPVADKNSLMSTHDIFSNMAKGSVGNEGGELFETWLVLEYCDRGSLAKAVRKGLLSNRKTGKPIMDHVLLSALDVANAMNYLHSLGITHGDLKADNVLLKTASTDRRGFFCKVSDFGLSRFMNHSGYIQTYTYGTITHMPPELLKDGILTPSVDIYSFGMLLWELLASLQPYSEKNHGEIILAVVNEGRRPHIGPGFPDCYADLIRDCWKQNRHDRPTFPEIVKRLKQMLVNLETQGSPCPAAMTDSAGSLSRIRGRIAAPSLKMEGEYSLTVSPVAYDMGSLPPETAPLPEVNRSTFYYDNLPSGEDREVEDAAGILLLSHHSSSFEEDDDIGAESNSSDDSASEGFRSAGSQITHSTDYASVSQHFAAT